MNYGTIESKIMRIINNKKLRVWLFVVSVLFIGGFLLLLNLKTPLLGDDYTYRFIFNTHDRVESVDDIVQSQINHYYTWGGRTVVHTIAQLLLLTPSLVMDIINSLAFMALLFLIYKHINYKRPFSLSLLLGVFLLLWFLEPFAETVLWITGSANYMWGTIIVLSFLLPYRCYAGGKTNAAGLFFKAILMLFVGVIAGWTNENIVAGLIVIIGLLIFYNKKNKVQIPIWMYSGLVGVLVGYAILILAPGNAARATDVETGVFSVVYRLFIHTQSLFNILGLMLLAYIVLFIIIGKQNKSRAKVVLSLSLIYQLGALVAIYVMVFSPSFPERAWFGVIVFNIIALGMLLVNIDLKQIHYVKYGFIVLGFIVFFLNIYDVMKDINYVDQSLKNREAYILEKKNEEAKVIYIDRYYHRTKYSMADPLYSEPMMPVYYGVTVKYKD